MSVNPDASLPITVRQDGTWLHFETSTGISAAVCLEHFAESAGPIVKVAILDWCKEQRHMHVAGTTVGQHIDKCAKCGRDLRDPVHYLHKGSSGQ